MTALALLREIVAHLSASLAAADPLPLRAGAVAVPPLVSPGAGYAPGTSPWLELDLLWDRPEQATMDVTRHDGVAQVSVFGRAGSGAELAYAVHLPLQAAWEAAHDVITGLRAYRTSAPMALAASPPGWEGYHLDTRLLWLAG